MSLEEKTKPGITLSFDDPRLRMTYVGRFFIRVISYVVYLFGIAAMVTFLISGVPGLFFV